MKYAIIISLLKLLSLLPLRVLYLLSDVLCAVVYRLVRYRLDVVRKNLRNALPDKTDDELRLIERRYYRHLCDCIVETVKLLHISDRQLRRRVEVRNSGLVDRAVAEGHPVILFLGHYGNWEWAQSVMLSFSCECLCGEIYRPLKNKTMDRVMRRIRSRFDTVCIPQRNAVRTLLRLKSDGRLFVVGFIADQYPNSRNRTHWTDFMNQRAAYVTGGEEIGRRVGARFVYLDIDKPQRGRYTMTFRRVDPLPDGDAEYPHTLSYLRMMEQTIRRAPEYWLWSHNRWKHKEPVPEQPAADVAGGAPQNGADTSVEPRQ